MLQLINKTWEEQNIFPKPHTLTHLVEQHHAIFSLPFLSTQLPPPPHLGREDTDAIHPRRQTPKSSATLTKANGRLSTHRPSATFTLSAAEPLLPTDSRPSVPVSSFSSFFRRSTTSLPRLRFSCPPTCGRRGTLPANLVHLLHLPRLSSSCPSRVFWVFFIFFFLRQLVGTSRPGRAHGYGCVWLAHEQKAVGTRAEGKTQEKGKYAETGTVHMDAQANAHAGRHVYTKNTSI